ncbi:MAG TPA: BsuPI-related putative proteinase inhibitor [Chthoniobacterales bacterium]|jgi:hypothetical protein
MKLGLSLLVALGLPLASGQAQEPAPSPTPAAMPSASIPEPAAPAPSPAPHSMLSRVLHPFSFGTKSDTPPKYKDPKLRGLILTLKISPETVKLSEVRLLDVKATLTNMGKKEVELGFVTDQRIEIYLMNTGDVVLTKWSDNHAVAEKPATILINPQEHIEYNEKISTRELTRDKVYVAEVFFPQYPEVRARQKFLTAP